MTRFKLKFIREIYMAFALLILAILAISWYFNENVRRHRLDVQRFTLGNNILQGYQDISNLTLRELNALSNSVLLGDASSMLNRESSTSALREALSRVRHGVASEIAYGWSTYEGGEPKFLAEIEYQVEELIRTGMLIEQALKDGRAQIARAELAKLINAGFVDNFINLLNAASSDHRLQLQNMGQEVPQLVRKLNTLMPIFLMVLITFTFLIAFTLSRRLNRSISELNKGAGAFKNGVYFYRIPELGGKEFQHLGETFNALATKLSEHREQLHDMHLKLDGMVEERTRELKISNMKLADADVQRRKLLADISHEFRTPITVIRGEAEIALRGANKTQAENDDSFRRIIEQADNATRLVDDLLFIARADAGEPRLKLSSVVITSVINALCDEFFVKAEQRGVTITHDRLDSKAIVEGDANRLRQVFAILLENALRYSNSGGRVEVRVTKTHEYVEIIIEDEGIGFSEEYSDLIFERFYRAPNAEAKASGTGLGLPVAKAIVEAHKGTISLKGKLGAGATATVILPINGQIGSIK
jgi:two-component system OmpR family sensor kinase